MYYAGLAEEFYHSACPNHTQNGYEKNVLMNVETEKCIFVSGDVQPSEKELLFRIKRAHGNTVTTLKTPRKEKVKPADQPVSGENARRRYKGIVRKVKLYEDYTTELVYPPTEIANEVIYSIKIDNLDDFLDKTSNRDFERMSSYELLKALEYMVIEDSPTGGYPYEVYPISDERYDDKGNLLYPDADYDEHVFVFSYFEKCKKGVCAVFTYAGVNTKVVEIEGYEY